jgi:type VI secretion system protein ImpI
MERLAPAFPVRIGRNPLNDVQLDLPYVSQFHAVLELDGQRLLLRDLGSKNGTQLPDGSLVAPHQPADLEPYQYRFGLGPLQVLCEPAQIAAPETAGRKRAASVESNFAATAMVGATDALKVGRLLISLREPVQAWRQALDHIVLQLERTAAELDPAARLQLYEAICREHPDLARHPDIMRLATAAGGGQMVAAFASEDSMVAQAVRELAATYVPSQTLRTAAQAVAFVGKIQDVLDVFFKVFVPLRDGHKQFESKMEIRRTGRPDGRDAANLAVRRAQNPAALAARLLDWTDVSADASRALEGVFADLMIHQVALLDGVMRGVRQMLKELSPAAIEAMFEKKKPDGMTFGPFRFKALWTLFKERHADLADEDTEAFELIFGSQFVSAYTQLADAQAAPPR